MKQYFNEIIYLIGEDRRRLPKLIILFLAGSMLDFVGIGLIGPYVALAFDPAVLDSEIGKSMIEVGFPDKKNELLFVVGIMLFGVFFLKAISAIFINYKIIQFSQNQQVYLRSLLMSSYQSLPYEEYINRNSSEYIHSIQSLVVQYADNVLMPSLRTISDIIVAIVIIVFLGFHSSIALLLLVVLLVFLIIGYDRLFRTKMKMYGKKANKAAALMVQGIHEGIEGLSEIRILGREKYFFDKVRDQALKFTYFQSRTRVVGTSPKFLLELLLISFVVLLVVVTISIGGDMQALIPTLAVFGVAAIRLLPAANGLSSSLVQIRFGRDAVSLLYKDLNYLRSLKLSNSRKKKIDSSFSKLTVENIIFNYKNTEYRTINQVSMEVKFGESVGIIGPSGSGKTTLINILLGLLEPSSGELLFNNEALSDNKEEWHTQVAYIPQQVLLIDNTLKRNIALGVSDEEIDDLLIKNSIEQASLTNIIKELPMGIDTILGERGIRLSGGQRQRVALARAFYHGRNVLVMDESTSSLDQDTEQEIVNEIKKLHGRKTMIVIAHRYSTLTHCDRIYKLDRGKIVNVGTPEELLKI